ncbi:MAG: methyltransferase domain-containing protein [Alphaproteobacteria bacterium]|nr:methyltransferase domain-containing protein [Alphaproteobacteria bacterium]
MTWSPQTYLLFEAERTRPVRELLAVIDGEATGRAVDLGCGPGNSTEALAARFPKARVEGLDSSPEMIAAARARLPRLPFAVADLRDWLKAPGPPCEVILSNAVLQWIPDHWELFGALAAALAPGGTLALQMPDNVEEPYHVLMRETARDGPWAGRLAAARRSRGGLLTAADYYQRLKPRFRRVSVWRTVYGLPMDSVDGVIAWFSSTALRPYLSALEGDMREAFLAAYRARLAAAYPPLAGGGVFIEFPRRFLLGEGAGAESP